MKTTNLKKIDSVLANWGKECLLPIEGHPHTYTISDDDIHYLKGLLYMALT